MCENGQGSDEMIRIEWENDAADAAPSDVLEGFEAEPLSIVPNGADAELQELREANLRIRADFDNFRRRTARERIELGERAQGDLIEKLLPVLDNFERALRAAEEAGAGAAWLEGVRMVHGQFLEVLEDASVRAIEAEGQEFDPMLHEAVATAPSIEVGAGHVLREVRRGYRVGDRVLRPTQVVTSSGSP
jgi:molecular chaperone GrpE